MAQIDIVDGRLPDNAFRLPRYYRAVVDIKTYRKVMLAEQGRILACGAMWLIVGKHLGAGIWEITLKED